MGHENLWQFAIDVYSQPGVEDLCLELQDQQNADVTLLLWCLWLDHCAVGFDTELWQRGWNRSAGWRRRAGYWRRLRRRLPKWPVVRVLRHWVKHRELRAERRVLQLLQESCKELSRCHAVRDQGYTWHYLRRLTGDDRAWCRLNRLYQ